MYSFRRYSVLVIAALSLAGCIVVDDFGDYWNKAFIDNCVNEIELNGQDNRPHNAKTMLMRSLRLGKHTFLMMREDAKDKGGNLVRYKIEDGKYVAYRLNESKREDFARDYPGAKVVLTSETATIPVLNADSVQLLREVADDEGYWVENRSEPYNPSRRDDCIQTLY